MILADVALISFGTYIEIHPNDFLVICKKKKKRKKKNLTCTFLVHLQKFRNHAFSREAFYVFMHIYDFFKRKMSNSFTSFNLEKVIIQYHLEMINVMLVKLLI